MPSNYKISKAPKAGDSLWWGQSCHGKSSLDCWPPLSLTSCCCPQCAHCVCVCHFKIWSQIHPKMVKCWAYMEQWRGSEYPLFRQQCIEWRYHRHSMDCDIIIMKCRTSESKQGVWLQNQKMFSEARIKNLWETGKHCQEQITRILATC